MPSKYELCAQCGAILKTPVCMKCGYDATVNAEVLDIERDLGLEQSNKDSEPNKSKETPGKIETHEQVRSIFNDMAVASGVVNTKTVIKSVRLRFLTPLILSLILFLLAGASYWRFIYFTPEYVSPMVLSAAKIKEVDGAVESTDVIEASENTDAGKTLELDTGLEEGNFTIGNFAQFGASDTRVFVQAFAIKKIFEKFQKEDVIKDVQTAYGISDDDLGVYFSNGFGYFIPGENLDTWGFAIVVNDKDYVEKRVDEFKKKKEDPKYKYSKYSVSLVEVAPKEDKPEGSNSDSEGQDSEKASTEELYLLVSNSKEYLDQMKESSEGNLTNLAEDVVYAQSKVDLPQIGEVLVYREKDTPLWSTLVDIVAEKYTYVGLDKILNSLKSTGMAFYSIEGNSKLRISLSEN